MRSTWLIRRIGIALAVGALVAAASATAGLAATTRVPRPDITVAARARAAGNGNRDNSRVAPDQAFNECFDALEGGSGYCDYSGTDGKDGCLTSGYGPIPDWEGDGLNCRNKDESFADVGSGLVRLYYSPNSGGAWACVNAGWYSNNLNKQAYTFDNGPGDPGFGDEIWENVASSQTSSPISSCSNPLPEDG